MSTPNDGGPAFPTAPAMAAINGLPVAPGMTLRDWFAGQEQLTEWDSTDMIPSQKMCEALADEKMPAGAWGGDIIAMLKWEAKWRAALRYIRADAMLAERAKGAKP